MGNMDVTARLLAENAQFDNAQKTSAEAATASGRAITKAAKDAAAAQAFAAKFAADEVSQQSLRIIASQKSEVTANAEYRQALAFTKKGLLDDAEGSQVAAAALQRLTAARLESAAAAKIETEAGHAAYITQQQAASATIRSLEGNAGIRAVERFITTIPGVGAALQSIFPLVGAVAFAGIIVDIGEKLYETEEKAAHAGEVIGEVFEASHDKAAVSIDDLAVTNDKLQDEIDKLSKHPNNGLATALDEARKMADQLVLSLQADRKELEGLLKDHEVGAFGTLLSGVSATKGQGKEMLQDQKDLTNAVRRANEDLDQVQAATTDAKKIKEATDIRNNAVHAAFQSQIDSYQRESGRLQKEQDDSRAAIDAVANDALASAAGAGGYGGGAATRAVDNSAKLANVQGRLQQLRDAMTQEKLQESIFARTSEVGKLKQENKPDDDKAARAKLKAFETQLAEMKQQTTVSAKAEYDYWSARIDSFKRGSEQYDAIVEKQAQLAVAGAKAAHEAILKFQKASNENANLSPDAANRGVEEFNKMIREQAEDVSRTGERWRSYNSELAKNAALMIKAGEASRTAQIDRAVKSGSLTKADAAQQVGQIHSEAFAQQIADLRAQLAEIKAQQAGLDKNSKDYLQQNPRLAAQGQGIQNEIASTEAAANLQAVKDQYAAFAETGLGGAVTALQAFTAASMDSATQIRQIVDSVMGNVNKAILTDLTENHNQSRGAWKAAGKSIFTDVAGSALKKGEGALMGALGVGKLGTRGNPMYIKNADGPAAGAMSSVASSSGASGLVSKLLGSVASFLPHFADGGDFGAGTTALVGERGPELVHFGSPGHVTPNGKAPSTGGSGDTHHTWNIDARGSTDPAQTMAMVQQGIMQAAPHIVAASLKAHQDYNDRRPPSARM
jgi:hypothetical protein